MIIIIKRFPAHEELGTCRTSLSGSGLSTRNWQKALASSMQGLCGDVSIWVGRPAKAILTWWCQMARCTTRQLDGSDLPLCQIEAMHGRLSLHATWLARVRHKKQWQGYKKEAGAQLGTLVWELVWYVLQYWQASTGRGKRGKIVMHDGEARLVLHLPTSSWAGKRCYHH